MFCPQNESIPVLQSGRLHWSSQNNFTCVICQGQKPAIPKKMIKESWKLILLLCLCLNCTYSVYIQNCAESYRRCYLIQGMRILGSQVCNVMTPQMEKILSIYLNNRHNSLHLYSRKPNWVWYIAFKNTNITFQLLFVLPVVWTSYLLSLLILLGRNHSLSLACPKLWAQGAGAVPSWLVYTHFSPWMNAL